jgi:hypothetical protein
MVKFVCAGLFGGFISLVLFLTVLWVDMPGFWESPWPHLFWVIPVVWGTLGIFWFDKMLDVARKLTEGFLGLDHGSR